MHTAERAMSINTMQGVASEAQIFLAFHATKSVQTLFPFSDLLKNGASFAGLQSQAGLALANGSAAPQRTNTLRHLLARPV